MEDTPQLEFTGPERVGDCDVYEAIDRSSDDPAEQVYSCVAICRTKWKPGWPALGGTRRYQDSGTDPAKGQQEARNEAIELAEAMYLKNTLLRHAAVAAGDGDAGSAELYGWQGGKGVIWTPCDGGAAAAEENDCQRLTPRRLICHARLLQKLAGEYIGSKDAGVASRQLQWIDHFTPYTIGLGCQRDTGEATAVGTLAGLEEALRRLHGWGELDDGTLAGRKVLVAGVGKVGLPLLGMLHERGAEVHVFEPKLAGASEDDIEGFLREKGAEGAVTEGAVWVGGERTGHADYGEALRSVHRKGHVLADEERALTDEEMEVVLPCGGPTGWLSTSIGSEATEGDRPSRAELLAETARQHGRLKLILGPGNDQVPMSEDKRGEREAALEALDEGGVYFVPDPLVSPGGVIAVSHELSPEWEADLVNGDSARIVETAVGKFFERYRDSARRGGKGGGLEGWRVMEELLEETAWS